MCCDRVVPLLSCYPREQQVTALQHLLLHWVAGQPGGGSLSSNLGLATAVVAREAELLQLAAGHASAADAGQLLAVDGPLAAPRLQQQGLTPPASPRLALKQQQQQRAGAAARGGDAASVEAAGSSSALLLWDGDVAALVEAVLAAVRGCTATNQWARLEALLNSAAAALAAAAAVSGLGQQQQQQPASSDGSGSSAGSDDGDDDERTQQRHTAGRERAAWDGFSDASSDADAHEAAEAAVQARGAVGTEQQQQAVLAAAGQLLRAAVGQHSLSPAQLAQLQQQLVALRGGVRAARLLTKHGCAVSIDELLAADAAVVNGWLTKVLSRAER
jgi:hypothetical protein